MTKKSPSRDEVRQNRRERFFARQIFELRVRRAKGEAFQELFNAVLQLRYPDFIPMRPYGDVGDRKNDGYLRNSGTFFQVYAPRDPTKSIAQAAKKAQDDFAGLYSHWNTTHTVRAYRFAFNDEYGGSVVPIEDALAAISQANSIPTQVFLAKDLETEAFELPMDKLERILDTLLPDPGEIADADYDAVRAVISHVMHSDAPNPRAGKLLAPDFTTKLQFNALSEYNADLLRVAARQSDVVGNFFSNRSGTHRQDLRDHLAEIYAHARQRAQKSRATADIVFVDILEAMQPPSRKNDRQIQNAALIVMAYYFEACDIFEAPDAST
ncbi:MAG: hypothetical protein IPM54_24365 [Polyangiaceae bacterium]|nr:hypothetical protein [Polyangiaceae bacterium]